RVFVSPLSLHDARPIYAKGQAEVGRFFERLAGIWDGLELELGDFVASGDRVCVIGQARGRLGGTETGYGFVHCWTVRGGVCTDLDRKSTRLNSSHQITS